MTGGRGLFFDLDGTLIDSRADLVTAVNLARAECGLAPLAPELVVSFVGNGLTNLALRSFAGAPDEAARRAPDLVRRSYTEHAVDATVLYPGVAAALPELRRAGFRLAVVTNKPERDARRILETLGAAGYFDRVTGADAGYALKPAPDALLGTAAELGLEPRRCWMLGDNYTDLAAGRAAGMSRAYAAWGFGARRDEASDADFDDFPAFARAMAAEAATAPTD